MPVNLAYLEEFDDEYTRAFSQGRVRSAAAAGQDRGENAITKGRDGCPGQSASYSLGNGTMERFMDKCVQNQVSWPST